MQMTPIDPRQTVIGQVLSRFASGDPTLLDLIAEDIDFRIDHYRDEADTSWQKATSREGLMEVLGRLADEVFPRGTSALGLDTVELGDGWCLTCFHQAFFYGVRQADVTSLTYILTHEAEGKLDFFRETVTGIRDA